MGRKEFSAFVRDRFEKNNRLLAIAEAANRIGIHNDDFNDRKIYGYEDSEELQKFLLENIDKTPDQFEKALLDTFYKDKKELLLKNTKLREKFSYMYRYEFKNDEEKKIHIEFEY